MFPYTIPNSTYLHKYAKKSMAEPPDLACGHFLEPGAGSVRVSQKNKKWKCLILLFPRNTFLLKDALKSVPEPPDLACGHFLEPWAEV